MASPNTVPIFEDLYRAKQRASLFELEIMLKEIEELPTPKGDGNIMAQIALRAFFGETLTLMETRFKELRAQFTALPELPARKEKEAV